MKVPRLARRALVIAGVSLGLAGLVVPGAWAGAAASDVIPFDDAPRPVNVLPSTVRGTAPLVGGTAWQNYNAVLLYSYARRPEFWRAVQAAQAGTATAGQLQVIQTANQNFGVPATKTSTLLKTVGGAAAAMSTFSLGTFVGNGVLDLIGYDAEGAVCRNTTGVAQDAVALITGVSCENFQQVPDTFVPNEEVTAGEIVEGLCTEVPGTAYSGQTYSSGSPAPIQSCSAGLHWWQQTTPTLGVPTTYGYSYVTGVSQVNSTTWRISFTNVLEATPTGGNFERSQVYAYCWSSTGWGPNTGSTGSFSVPAFGSTTQPGPQTRDITFLSTCNTGVGLTMRVREGVSGTSVGDPGQFWFYKPGETLEPPEVTSGDPFRVLRCVVVHSGGELTRDSATFRESEGVIPQVLCPDVTGLVIESVKVLNVNLDDGSELVLYEESTTTEYQDHQVLAPECADGTCLLDLRKESVGSCFQSPASCGGWYADPDKGSKYSCHYGTHAVDLAECTIYAPAFEPGASTTGNTYGDPETGQVVTNPNPTAGTDPDGSGRECFPSGWAAFNPIEWIYRPIICAFVPREAVLQEVGLRVSTAWSDTLPAQAPEIVSAWAGALPEDAGGCLGPPINFDDALGLLGVEGGGTSYPLSACEEPMATIALIANWVVSGSVALAGAFAIVRYVAATIGFAGFGKGNDGSTS